MSRAPKEASFKSPAVGSRASERIELVAIRVAPLGSPVLRGFGRGGGCDHQLGCEFRTVKFGDDAAAVEDERPVADMADLLEVGRHHRDREFRLERALDEAVDFRFRADINSQAVGSSATSSRRPVASQRPTTTFC